MKKRLLGLMLLLAPYMTHSSAVVHIHGHKPAPAVYTHTYTPVHGPLQLFDMDSANPGDITRSLSNPTLNQASAAIARFAATAPGANSYQDIIAAIAHNPGNQLAMDALRAFEQVIMHLYHHEAYAIGLPYSPWRSMLIGNGVRCEWFKPLSWFNPKSWISDNNKKLEQLISELDQLADIANQHSITLSTRMKMTVQSYKNWRNGFALLLATYIGCRSGGHILESLAEDTSTAASAIADMSSQAACSAGNALCEAGSTAISTGADLANEAFNTGCDLTSNVISASCDAVCDITSAAISTSADLACNAISSSYNALSDTTSTACSAGSDLVCNALGSLKFW